MDKYIKTYIQWYIHKYKSVWQVTLHTPIIWLLKTMYKNIMIIHTTKSGKSCYLHNENFVIQSVLLLGRWTYSFHITGEKCPSLPFPKVTMSFSECMNWINLRNPCLQKPLLNSIQPQLHFLQTSDREEMTWLLQHQLCLSTQQIPAMLKPAD